MIKKFLYSLPFLLAGTGAAYAQNGTSISVPTDFTGIAWADFVTTLAGALAPALIAMLGLAAGVFLVRYIWSSIKSISR